MMEFTDPETGVTARSNGSPAGDAFHAAFVEACLRLSQAKAAWIAKLRAEGIKAAHPDDGWVDREQSIVRFAYPQFDDGADVGDLIALGDCDRYRLVRIVGTERDFFSAGRWRFEAAELITNEGTDHG